MRKSSSRLGLFLCLACAPQFAAAQVVRDLDAGSSTERPLSGGDVHIYRIRASSGQYLRAIVVPDGVEFTAALLAPGGDKIAEAVNLAGHQRAVSISAVTAREGDYQLQVKAGATAAGKYRLTVSELRSVIPLDEKRIAAEASLTEGKRLRAQGTRASLERAIERLQAAARLSQEAQDAEGEAISLMQLGSVYLIVGQLSTYMDVETRALALWRGLHDRAGEGEALNNLGLVFWAQGDRDEALEKMREALPLRSGAGDRRGEVETLNNIATVYAETDDWQTALAMKQDVLKRHRALGDRDGEAGAYNDLAVIYSKLGKTERAQEYFHQALALRRELGNRRSEAVNLLNIGTEYAKGGDSRKALDNLMPALKLLRETGNRPGESVALQHIGRAHAMRGENAEALQYFEQALAIQRLLKMSRAQAFTENYAAAVERVSGRPKEAMAYLNESLVLARSVGDRMLESDALVEMARVHRDLGELEQALALIDESVHLTEAVRSSVASEELRTSYLATTAARYELFVDLLMSLHQKRPGEGFDVRALEISERARARGLLDLLTEARAEIREGVEPALLNREQALRKALDDKTQRQIRLLAVPHSAEQAAKSEKDVRALTQEYESVETELRASSPRYAALTQPQPLKSTEIRQLLDEDTVLLEYWLGERRSVLWVVSAASVDTFELPKRADVEPVARQAYDALSVHGAVARNTAVAALSRMAFGSAAPRLAQKRLVIVSQGILQYIPFSALTIPGERGPAIESHEVVHLPSASALAELRREIAARKPAPKAVAVLADPVFEGSDERVKRRDTSPRVVTASAGAERAASPTEALILNRLRASREEAQAIVKLAGGGQSLMALDFRASRATAMSAELADYRIVHFATHGLLNTQHPELSGLVLSMVDPQGRPQDGFLEAMQIYNLKLRADLVVLSACQTALGKDVRAEGIVGLTRGFMYAGAPRVVASVWRVPDQATRELMTRFYQAVLVKGLRPAAALRAAQSAMLADPRWSEPYYWAGFALQGEWK